MSDTTERTTPHRRRIVVGAALALTVVLAAGCTSSDKKSDQALTDLCKTLNSSSPLYGGCMDN